MTPREFFVNLWANAFETPETPGKLAPPEPWPDPPAPLEPSCFAKGIARSIEVEPDQWDDTEPWRITRDGWVPPPVLDITHRQHNLRVTALGLNVYRADGGLLPGYQRISSVIVANHCLTKGEEMLIARTIEACPLGQLARAIRLEREKSVREASALSHFTQLGCPQ